MLVYILCSNLLGPLVSGVGYHVSIEQPEIYYERLKPLFQVSFNKFSNVAELEKSCRVNGLPEHFIVGYHHPGSTKHKATKHKGRKHKGKKKDGSSNHIIMVTTDKDGNRILAENSGKDQWSYSKPLKNAEAEIFHKLSRATNIRLTDLTDPRRFVLANSLDAVPVQKIHHHTDANATAAKPAVPTHGTITETKTVITIKDAVGGVKPSDDITISAIKAPTKDGSYATASTETIHAAPDNPAKFKLQMAPDTITQTTVKTTKPNGMTITNIVTIIKDTQFELIEPNHTAVSATTPPAADGSYTTDKVETFHSPPILPSLRDPSSPVEKTFEEAAQEMQRAAPLPSTLLEKPKAKSAPAKLTHRIAQWGAAAFGSLLAKQPQSNTVAQTTAEVAQRAANYAARTGRGLYS